jgi:hypothetical protein
LIAKLPALVVQVRELTRTRLGSCFADALDSLPATLRELSALSATAEEHRLVARAMEQMHRDRQGVAAAFEQQLLSSFDRQMNKSEAKPPPPVATPFSELVLVEDAALELQLALGKLVRTTLDEIDTVALVGIEMRLGELAACNNMSGAANPIGPEAVLDATQKACAAAGADGAIRTTLVNGLQPHIAAGLRSLYKELNDLMVSEGVVPPRPGIERAPTSPKQQSAPMRKSAGGMRISQVMSLRELLPSSASSPIDLGSILATLLEDSLANRKYGARMLADEHASLYPNAVATPVNEALLASLSQMQSAATLPPGGSVGAQDLQAVVHHMQTTQEHPLDRLTGELVTVVFDFLLGDKNLNDAVKAELARLQIVALKAALLDRSFFAQREHPLRLLLEEVTRLANDPALDMRRDGPFLSGLREIVTDLVEHFDTDFSLFKTATERVQALADEATEESDMALGAMTASLMAEERLSYAQELADAAVAQQMQPDTPAFVRRFLEQVWAKALARARADPVGGEAAWLQRLQTQQTLLWSVQPKSREELPAFTAALPKLVSSLQEGIRASGASEEQAQGFLAELMKVHKQMLQASRAAPASAIPPVPPAIDTKLAAHSDKAVREPILPRGTIVEFCDAEPPTRAKLSWVSPARMRYVFTGNAGAPRAFNEAQLSEALAQGKVRVIDDTESSLGRALAAVVGEDDQPAD